MKAILFPLCLLFCLEMTAQKTGYLITTANETIDIYQRPSKKKALSVLKKGCDCQILASKFIYCDKEGEVIRIKNQEIDKIVMHKGTNYCADYSQENRIGGPNMSGVLGLALPEDMEMLCLPTKKNGGRKVLQTSIVSSPEYLLTMHQSEDMSQYLFIYDVKNDYKLIKSRISYMGVGFGKEGKKSLTTIQSYFRGCSALNEKLDKAIDYNESVKKRQRMPILLNVTGTKCE